MPGYFAYMNARMWRRTKNPLLWSDFIYNYVDGDGPKVKADVAKIHEFCSGLLHQRREDLASGKRVGVDSEGRPSDFMQHLLTGGESKGMSDDEIVSTVTGLIFASFDTGCTALSWIFYA